MSRKRFHETRWPRLSSMIVTEWKEATVLAEEVEVKDRSETTQVRQVLSVNNMEAMELLMEVTAMAETGKDSGVEAMAEDLILTDLLKEAGEAACTGLNKVDISSKAAGLLDNREDRISNLVRKVNGTAEATPAIGKEVVTELTPRDFVIGYLELVPSNLFHST